jgi:hypothetical protein
MPTTTPVQQRKAALASVTVKQGTPSKPGEKVDTTKATVTAAAKKGSGAKAAKPKAAKGDRRSVKGNPLTLAWTGKDGKDIPKGSRVKDSVTGIIGVVTSRWTRATKDGPRVPCVSVEPEGATATATVGGRSVRAIGIPAAQLVLHGKQPTTA